MNTKLLYISGSGRSGTTLLDIVLGAQRGHFSCGELNNFVRKGLIEHEYCSCGEVVCKCPFWSDVLSRWNNVRKLSLEEYRVTQREFSRNKAFLRLMWNYFFPGSAFRAYLNDTLSLYQILFEVSRADVLVDSSKNPLKILILRKLTTKGLNFEVVHLLRDFSSVLNSHKKVYAKDVKSGVEKDKTPKRKGYFLYLSSVWIFENVAIKLFSIGMSRTLVRYSDYVTNLPAALRKLVAKENIIEIGDNGFSPKHLVAGNRLRMKKKLIVAADTLESHLDNLTSGEKTYAKIVDRLFK